METVGHGFWTRHVAFKSTAASSLRFSKRWQISLTGQINWLWYLAHLLLKPIRTCLPSQPEKKGRRLKCVGGGVLFDFKSGLWCDPDPSVARRRKTSRLLMKRWAIIKATSYWSWVTRSHRKRYTKIQSHTPYRPRWTKWFTLQTILQTSWISHRLVPPYNHIITSLYTSPPASTMVDYSILLPNHHNIQRSKPVTNIQSSVKTTYNTSSLFQKLSDILVRLTVSGPDTSQELMGEVCVCAILLGTVCDLHSLGLYVNFSGSHTHIHPFRNV